MTCIDKNMILMCLELIDKINEKNGNTFNEQLCQMNMRLGDFCYDLEKILNENQFEQDSNYDKKMKDFYEFIMPSVVYFFSLRDYEQSNTHEHLSISYE